MKGKISIKEAHKKKISRITKPEIKKKTEKEKRQEVLDLYLKGYLKRCTNKKIRYEKV